MGTTGPERLSHGPAGSDAMAILPDVFSDDLGSVSVTVHDIVDQRLLHVIRCVEKHHVNAHPKATPLSCFRDHALPVVGDRELDRFSEVQLEPPLERLPRPLVDEYLWARRRKPELDLSDSRIRNAHSGRGHARRPTTTTARRNAVCHRGVVPGEGGLSSPAHQLPVGL